jgi:hypothetical protein
MRTAILAPNCSFRGAASYDSVRPVTAIDFLFQGQQIMAWGGPYRGAVMEDGSQWIPYQPSTFLTPPFSEYISGHSTFSAAGAEILKRFTHSDNFGASVTFLAGSSNTEPGLTPQQSVTLSWATFSDAADEAGISRRYGGIHFEAGDLVGRATGRLVAAKAWHKAQSYINNENDDVENAGSGARIEAADPVKLPEHRGQAKSSEWARPRGSNLVCSLTLRRRSTPKVRKFFHATNTLDGDCMTGFYAFDSQTCSLLTSFMVWLPPIMFANQPA